jgi:hypothetical protein
LISTWLEGDVDEGGDEIGWLAALSRAPVLQGAELYQGVQGIALSATRREAARGFAWESKQLKVTQSNYRAVREQSKGDCTRTTNQLVGR